MKSIRLWKVTLVLAIMASLALTGWSVAVSATGPISHVQTNHRHHSACSSWHSRNVSELPAPLIRYQVQYVPPQCDPMHKLFKQAWRVFACIRWHESGDRVASDPRGSYGSTGLYQFEPGTWDAYGGQQFAEFAWEATAFQQDRVAYRVFKAEQFLPWINDPCVGSLAWLGRFGWWPNG